MHYLSFFLTFFKNKKHRHLSSSQSGVTLVETMTVIGIFGALVVFCLGVFLFFSRVYHRGLVEREMQDVARAVVTDITEDIQTSGIEVNSIERVKIVGNNNPGEDEVKDKKNKGNYWYAFCVGSRQYSFMKNVQLIVKDKDDLTDDDYNKSDKVLILSNKCSANAEDFAKLIKADFNSDENNPQEILSEYMRIVEFDVHAIDSGDGRGGELYEVRIKLAYGGDPSDCEIDNLVFDYYDDGTGTPSNQSEDPVFISDKKVDSGGNLVDKTARKPCGDPDNNRNGFNNYDPDNEYIQSIQFCGSRETFCSVLELEKRVFRKLR